MSRIRTEAEVRKALTLAKYDRFLKEKYPRAANAGQEELWNPETGSCGFHSYFTEKALGVEDYREYEPVRRTAIPWILHLLENGEVLFFLHNYLEGDHVFQKMPKDNRYPPHMFVVVKGGDKYFLSQGYLHEYTHSLVSYTREDLVKMFEEIIDGLSDFGKTKTWADLDLHIYKKYFKVNMRMLPHRRVNGIALFMSRQRDSKA
jgi:hypothetical protein